MEVDREGNSDKTSFRIYSILKGIFIKSYLEILRYRTEILF